MIQSFDAFPMNIGLAGKGNASLPGLHDMGAFSIIASDSQAVGRIGEVIIHTWQTADKMKRQRGSLSEETGDNDNFPSGATSPNTRSTRRARMACRSTSAPSRWASGPTSSCGTPPSSV